MQNKLHWLKCMNTLFLCTHINIHMCKSTWKKRRRCTKVLTVSLRSPRSDLFDIGTAFLTPSFAYFSVQFQFSEHFACITRNTYTLKNMSVFNDGACSNDVMREEVLPPPRPWLWTQRTWQPRTSTADWTSSSAQGTMSVAGWGPLGKDVQSSPRWTLTSSSSPQVVLPRPPEVVLCLHAHP